MPFDRRRGALIQHLHTRRTDSQVGQDGGFTLLELLIVVAIMPLVVGAISVALLSVFNNQQQVANGLTSSSDEQVSGSIFVKDVQSANWITNNAVDVCGGTSGTLLLSLSPDDVANTPASPIQNVISYVEVPNAGSSTFTILRETCAGGSGSPATTTRGVTHGASTGTAVSIVPTSLNISNWVAASSATSVSLNLSEPDRPGSGTTNSYTLTAVPRTTDTPGQTPTGGFSPILPFELVGPCPGVNFTGASSSLTIQNGNGGPGIVGTTQSQQQCSSLSSNAPPATLSSGAQYYNVPNPLANLTPPSFPSLSGLAAGSCTATTCTSGVYGTTTTGAYTYGGGGANVSKVTFDPSLGPNPGIVVFTVPLTAGGVTFDGGSSVTSVTYWFQAGLTISAQTTDTFGSATYIYGSGGTSGTACQGSVGGTCVLQMGTHATIAVPDSSPGLLFYVPPGTSNVSLGSGFTGTLAGALSPYLGVAIWDASSGILNFGQGNGGGAGIANFGGIYDPNGTVNIAGGYNMRATYFVVHSFSIQTSAALATG
jgi:prepilin-type N-terminal cleavage/methylation domain-containing protein